MWNRLRIQCTCSNFDCILSPKEYKTPINPIPKQNLHHKWVTTRVWNILIFRIAIICINMTKQNFPFWEWRKRRSLWTYPAILQKKHYSQEPHYYDKHTYNKFTKSRVSWFNWYNFHPEGPSPIPFNNWSYLGLQNNNSSPSRVQYKHTKILFHVYYLAETEDFNQSFLMKAADEVVKLN